MNERPDSSGFMRANAPEPGHWWGRRLPSVLTLAVVLLISTVAVWVITDTATDVLPEVGKDRLGADNWSDPLGVHLANGFQVVRVPDCAAGAFTRFVLWDPDSEPYWEVHGPPTPLNTFLVGVPPEGFTTATSFRDPPAGEVLRLVAFRRDGGAVGIRYQVDDLRTTRVVSGNPLVPYTIEGFQKAEVCDSVGDGVTTDSAGVGDVEADVDGPGGTVVDGDGFSPSVPAGLGAGGSGSGSSTTIDDGTSPTGPTEE